MFTEIRLRISQTVLRFHRQHDGKLNHRDTNLALWVTQNDIGVMLHVNRIEMWTLFSLLVQGAAVTTKTSDKNQMANESKIMNAPIVSAEAKARLTEAVKNYTPPAPEKYRALNEVKESIIALRERKASYETIRAMLHENAGIEVSHQTVARYCREVLDAAKAKKPRRPKTPPTEPPASAQGELAARPPFGQSTATRTAHRRFQKSLAQQRRCRQSRRPKSDSQSNPPILKSKSLWGSTSATNARSQPCNARSSRTSSGKNAVAFASVCHWQRRSGARLHSCRFADRLPLSAANARPKQVQI